jgi:hypothetical protein
MAISLAGEADAPLARQMTWWVLVLPATFAAWLALRSLQVTIILAMAHRALG